MGLTFRRAVSSTLLPVLFLTGLITGCRDSTGPPVPTTITLSDGVTSFSALGDTATFTAQVFDEKGRVMREAPITWSSSAPELVYINPSSGLATARANGTATVRATSGAASGTRDVTVTQVPHSISAVAGNGQTGYAMEGLGDSLVVQVMDRLQAPIAGVQVAWTVTGGGGSFSPSSGITDAAGRATTEWTLGTPAGQHTASASVQGVTPLALSADALPNGIITGTVTVTSQYLSPLQGGAELRSSGTGLASRAPAGGPALTSPGLRSPVGVKGPGGTGPGLRSSSPAMGPAPNGLPARAVPGELLVVFRENAVGAPALGSAAYTSPGVSRRVEEAMTSVMRAHPVAHLFELQAVSPAGMAAKIRVPDESTMDEVAAALRRDPRVRAVEPNYLVQGPPPPPESRASPWTPPASDRFYPFQAWHYEMIGLPDAWEITKGSHGVTVAVVDDGIRFDHWDLAANLTADGYDFVEPDTLPHCNGGIVDNAGDGTGPDPDPTTPAVYAWDSSRGCAVGPFRYGGHGAHVAGTIGAVGGNDGAVGVNWTVMIRPVRVMGTLGYGSWWSVSQGILYAAGLPASTGTGTVQAPHPAHVINMSIGGEEPSQTLALAVTQAAAAGSLLVASAGNTGQEVPRYPAFYPEVLAVSAVDPWSGLSSYSTFGPWVDIAAPGGALGSDVPGYTTEVLSTGWDFQENRSIWYFSVGTSMAAPHVSGVAALLFAANPGIDAAGVRERLLDYANPVGPPDFFGAGIVDAFASLTEGTGWPRAFHVRLVDASTGREVATVPAAADGSFRISRLPDGEYMLFAGLDERNDGQIGVPGRFWGARGGSATPSALPISEGGVYPASFSIGGPIEQEPNDQPDLANYLAVGGYLNGSLSSTTDQDWFAVQIPVTGTYTFMTHGWLGACGFAAQANTALHLFNSGGTLMGSNEDVDAAAYRFCSEITRTLSPGWYFLRVTGSASNSYGGPEQGKGYYRVSARKTG